MDRVKWALKQDSESRARVMIRYALWLVAAALLLLLLTAPSQAQEETPARQMDAVLANEYVTRCSKSYDPPRCNRWLDLMNEAIGLEAALLAAPEFDRDCPRPLTTAEQGERKERRERLLKVAGEMRRLLPKVRGESSRRRLSALVEEMARFAPLQ